MKLKVDIGRLDKRISIQKRIVTADTKLNQIPEWTDFHICWAAVNGVSNKEYWQSRQQHEENIVNFKIRFCDKLKSLNKKDYRIIFDGKVYDITYIDNVLFADSILNIKGAEIL